jgi:hypothetical protein
MSKTLASDFLLLYDRDCPLCVWYTKTMVQQGLLNASSRVSFQEVDPSMYPYVDFKLAQDKIAFINPFDQQVSYGIDALRAVLAERFPWVGRILDVPFFYFFFSQVYLFISLNRKVIIPISCNSISSCNPQRNWFWRSLFVLITFLLAVLFLVQTNQNLLLFSFSGWLVLRLALFFMLLTGVFCWILSRRIPVNLYSYAGHWSMVLITTAFFAMVFSYPVSLLHSLGYAPELHPLSSVLLGIVLFIFLHIRRVQKTGDSPWLHIVVVVALLSTFLLQKFLS